MLIVPSMSPLWRVSAMLKRGCMSAVSPISPVET